MNERFFIHCADDINKQLFDTKSDFNIHIEEVCGDEDLLIRLCELLNELSNENEHLREELSECEKFRYSVFKRMEKTIENKDNCVLNKDAKFPCKAYDECLKIQGTNKPLPCVVNWMMGRTFKNMLRREGDDE